MDNSSLLKILDSDVLRRPCQDGSRCCYINKFHAGYNEMKESLNSISSKFNIKIWWQQNKTRAHAPKSHQEITGKRLRIRLVDISCSSSSLMGDRKMVRLVKHMSKHKNITWYCKWCRGTLWCVGLSGEMDRLNIRNNWNWLQLPSTIYPLNSFEFQNWCPEETIYKKGVDILSTDAYWDWFD